MSESSPIKISIVIPVKNGKTTIESCLNAIFRQTLIAQAEVIIIDSGSTDGTLMILDKYPVRLYEILPQDFNHGDTRNYGASLAKGEFVVMTVQDATPIGDKWLETMINHFEDKTVAGVCGQQIVPHHDDKNPHKWFRPQNKPNVRVVDPRNMPANFHLRGWDDVNAMYRKATLKKIPFNTVDFGEDYLWATQAFKSGYILVFDSNSKVEHYHHASPQYVYKRIMTELYFEYQHYNSITAYPLSIRELLLIVYRNFKYQAHPKWIGHNWAIQFMKYKAWMEFKKSILNNTLETTYALLKAGIPQGQQNND